MPWPVIIYALDGETRFGDGTLEALPRESEGQYRARLRAPPELEEGAYVLRFKNGERWAIKTLSKPGRRFLQFGGRVAVVSDDPPPALP